MTLRGIWIAVRRVVAHAVMLATVGTGMLATSALAAGGNTGGGASVPNITSTAPPGSDKFTTVLGYGLWAAILVCVAGFMYAGGKLAMAHERGGYGGGAQTGLVNAAIGCVVVGSAAGIVRALI